MVKASLMTILTLTLALNLAGCATGPEVQAPRPATAPAVDKVRQAAQDGDVRAQLALGDIYLSGRGVSQDYGRALHWYRRAAGAGNVEAQHRLGTMYEDGRGVARDYGQAFQWYRKAAQQGLADAQWDLGRMYYEGYGVAINHVQAFFWWRKGAAQGHPEARFAVDHGRPSYDRNW